MKTLDLILDLLDLVYRFLARFFVLVFSFIASLFISVYRWFKGVLSGVWGLWLSLGPKWLRLAIVVSALLIGGYALLKSFLAPNLTHENIYTLHYLNEGWSEEQREIYYYTPQGTELLGLEYDWFTNLELPMSRDLLAAEDNMRGWGFIVSPGQRPSERNPGNLPVGFSRHTDPISGKQRLDLGCAMCHTGELHYKGVALRVDGGQALQSVPTAKRGEFITTLGASVIATLINPRKWDRFATRLVGDDEQKREKLREDLWQYFNNLKAFVTGAGASKYYPVEEGRGRTDAVGRIGNIVFGYDLDEPSNYKIADAPASYPFLWDIWRFDWVQYTGFTNQAMARNVGESLGVLAPIKLVDKEGNLLPAEQFGETIVDIDGMHCVESTLRELKPPKWPESILGEINITSAKRGKDLFAQQCAFCHGPHISKTYDWDVATGPNDNPANQAFVNYQWDLAGQISEVDGVKVRKDWRETIWAVPWIATDTIGTDAKLADNYNDHKYDGSKLVPGSEPVNAGDGLQLLLNRLVPELYKKWDITDNEVANFDGLNTPFRIENKRAYKARPLHGVWATPPFLHNGSVPNIYALLSPLRERPPVFYVGNREYDPEKLGYETGYSDGSFKHDTSIAGNHNTGHLFTDVEMPGRIGKLLTERQRVDIIEYIKIMGNPDFSQKIGGDPLNWEQYTSPPKDEQLEFSCARSKQRHAQGIPIAHNLNKEAH